MKWNGAPLYYTAGSVVSVLARKKATEKGCKADGVVTSLIARCARGWAGVARATEQRIEFVCCEKASLAGRIRRAALSLCIHLEEEGVHAQSL